MNWETVLLTNNREEAKQLVNKLAETRKEHGDNFNELAKAVGYHYTNVWDKGELSPHFRRILVELKLLAFFGKALFIHQKPH